MRNDNHPTTRLRGHHILLCAVILLAGVITTTAPLAAQLPADPDPERELQMTVAEGFTVTAVGDVIIARPISQGMNIELTEVIEVLQRPDVTFGNFETSAIDLQDFDGYQAAEHGGAWLIGPPAVADDLKTMGFDMMARANNHTTDWGVEGMRSTTKILDEAGIVHAGAGETLALARAGRYFETPKGRVAVVSMASSFTPLSRAMNPLGEAPGRPGLSPVRTTRHTLITQEEMDVLVGIRDSIAAYRRGETEAGGESDEEPVTELSSFGTNFRVANHRGYEHDLNEIDLGEILAAIKQAKRNSDFVIATIHAHDPGNWSDQPPDFLEELAHKAIDAGADQFVGHGPHQLRGLEIYKGKPIFYSLANFVFQVELQEPVGQDLYDRYNIDPKEVTNSEFNRRFLERSFGDSIWYESVIAESRYEGGTVAEIRLYPVELGYEKRGAHRGVPGTARPEVGQQILETMQRLSAPYNTTMTIEDGVGVVRVSAAVGANRR